MTDYNFFKSRFLAFSFAILLIQYSIQAETVILRSHEVIHGKISFQNAHILRMKDDIGKDIELQKNDILKVSYRDVKDAKEIKKIIEEEENKLPPEKRKKVVISEKRSRWSIVWRSTLVPGWGQWKSGNRWYAPLSILAVLGAFSNSATKQNQALNAKKEYSFKMQMAGVYTTMSYNNYKNSQTELIRSFLFSASFANSFYEPYQKSVSSYNHSLQFIGIAYGLQLVHSYFLGKAWEKDNPNTTIGNKAVFGDWNINVYPRQANAQSGVTKESYYEFNYEFQF